METENRVGTLPRNWERAFGYDGEARHVAFYWSPVGDEALYDDGQASGNANWRLFLTLRHQHPEFEQRHNIGDSDVEADHWLLLDREMRDLVAISRAEAQVRLHRQWSPLDLDVELTALDWETIQEAVQQAVDNVQAGMEQIQPCDTCFYSIAPGWLQTADGGFDPCPVCNGWGFLPGPPELTILESQGAEVLSCPVA